MNIYFTQSVTSFKRPDFPHANTQATLPLVEAEYLNIPNSPWIIQRWKPSQSHSQEKISQF